jgi:hypothetical protein
VRRHALLQATLSGVDGLTFDEDALLSGDEDAADDWDVEWVPESELREEEPTEQVPCQM